MYQNEKFKKVGSVAEGALVLKLPGTDFKMVYSGGNALVNAQGNVGFVSLSITDAVAQKVGKAEGLLGSLGEQLTEQLADPEIKAQMREAISKDKLHLAYSRTTDGKEVLTMPGMGDEGVDYTTIEGKVVALYNTKGKLPSKEDVYALHTRAVAGKQLVSDKKAMLESATTLVDKANSTYKQYLKVMKASGF